MKVNLLELGQAAGKKITGVSLNARPGDIYIRRTKIVARPYKVCRLEKGCFEHGVSLCATLDEAYEAAYRKADNYWAVIDETGFEEEQA
jgi:hypothetical protein